MSVIRTITEEDYAQAIALHEKMGADYKLDLSQSDFVVKNGLFENGKLVSAVLGRLTTEAYLLLDRQWATPQERMAAVEKLAGLSASEAKLLYGVQDTHVWIPPRANCFVRRLQRMGFVDAPWKCLTARI